MSGLAERGHPGRGGASGRAVPSGPARARAAAGHGGAGAGEPPALGHGVTASCSK